MSNALLWNEDEQIKLLSFSSYKCPVKNIRFGRIFYIDIDITLHYIDVMIEIIIYSTHNVSYYFRSRLYMYISIVS